MRPLSDAEWTALGPNPLATSPRAAAAALVRADCAAVPVRAGRSGAGRGGPGGECGPPGDGKTPSVFEQKRMLRLHMRQWQQGRGHG